MINPNNITNVSFAQSPALQAILNSNNVIPINPVDSTKAVSTDSYIVQQQASQKAATLPNAVEVQSAVLEHTPKTDVYEPMHKKDDNQNGSKHKSAGKTVAKAGIGIATLLAAVIFAPKVARALLGNVDATKPVILRGKDAFTAENAKVALKKVAKFVEAQSEKISNTKPGEFVKAQVSNVMSAFKKDGVIRKQAQNILSFAKKAKPSA